MSATNESNNMIAHLIKKLYIWSTGYSYTHMGRLFLRLFVGVMLLQFGVRQWIHFGTISDLFPAVGFLTPSASLSLMIGVEIVCSLFIMTGFLTRLMTVPPFIAMCCAEYYLLTEYVTSVPWQLSWSDPGYLPMMFLGIYFFIMVVGPGKISVDYFLSLHIIHSSNKSEDELEEV